MKIPISMEGLWVGSVDIENPTVKRLEKLMECKFDSLDNEPFVIAAVFKSNTEQRTVKLVELEIKMKET